MKIPITLQLILPVFFPSWRFFSGIDPSPRVQYALLASEREKPTVWKTFRSLQHRISIWQAMQRLFWNPKWNETLYINSCAERLFDGYSPMREHEIMRRILAAIYLGEIQIKDNDRYIVFRILALAREGQEVIETLVFVSKPASLK
jgi:hypothetical protein